MRLKCKNKFFNRRKGSSSVLVIMVMLMLITFGVLAMMSSYSNLKIARKNAQWVQGYYALESLTEKNLKALSLLLDDSTLTYVDILSQIEKVDEDSFEFDPSWLVYDDESANYYLSFLTHLETLERMMYVKIEIDTSASGKLLNVVTWKELPRAFEYDDGIDFVDVGGL